MYSERGRYVINILLCIYIRTDPITLPCSLARAGNYILEVGSTRITIAPGKFLSFGQMNLAHKDVCILQTQKKEDT